MRKESKLVCEVEKNQLDIDKLTSTWVLVGGGRQGWVLVITRLLPVRWGFSGGQ